MNGKPGLTREGWIDAAYGFLIMLAAAGVVLAVAFLIQCLT